MNNHLKSILKVCGIVGLICLVTVLSCLPFVNFDNNKVAIHADSEITDTYFSSSNFLIPVAFSTGDENAPLVASYGVSFATLNINLYYVSDSLSFNIDVLSASTNFLDNQYGFLPSVSTTTSSFSGSNLDNNWVHSSMLVNDFVNSQFTTDFFLNFNYKNNSFNGTVAYIIVSYINNINRAIDGTSIEFFDTVGNSIQFQFFGGSNSNPRPFSNYFDYVPARTIFIIQNLSDNDYYISGYNDGYTRGLSIGSDGGYDIGYDKGYSNGLIVGYNRGLDEQNIYTFGNLLTAVVDAPVGVFVSMLDFNIMGFNLLNLVVGLLTLAVICLVVKLILGGK